MRSHLKTKLWTKIVDQFDANTVRDFNNLIGDCESFIWLSRENWYCYLCVICEAILHCLVIAQSRSLKIISREAKRADWPLILKDDGMATSGFLEIFMTQKMLGSLSEVSCDSTEPTKIIAEQENNFWKD